MHHPTPIRSLDQLWEHAPIGALPGEVVLAIGFFSSTPGAEEFEAYVEPVKQLPGTRLRTSQNQDNS